MSVLTFPSSPVNGQQYPDPAIPGVNVYKYNAATTTWELLGVGSGVTPGTYGNDYSTLEISVGPTGSISDITQLAIRPSSISQSGIVQLNDTLTSTSVTEALTANQGRELYELITNGDPGDGVTFIAINDISSQFNGVKTSFVLTSSLVPLPSSLTDADLFIEVGGVLQAPGANYTWNPATSTIIFSSAPLSSYAFNGRYFTTVGTTVAECDNLDDISSQFNGSLTTFSLTVSGSTLPINTQTQNIIIQVGGIDQGPPLNWTFDNATSTITFTTAPTSGLDFSGRVITSVTTSVLLRSLLDISSQFDNVRTEFAVQTSSGLLPNTTISEQLLLFVGGILQAPDVNYVYNPSTSVLSFSSAPATGWAFDCRAAIVTGAVLKGNVSSVNTGAGLTGGPIVTTGTISLLPATTTSIGGIRPDGTGVTVSSTGILSLLPATTTTLGGVRVDGTTIAVSPTGVISVVAAQNFWQKNGTILSPISPGTSIQGQDIRAQVASTSVYAGFGATSGAMNLLSSSAGNAEFRFFPSGGAINPVAVIDPLGSITSLNPGGSSGVSLQSGLVDPVTSSFTSAITSFIPGAGSPPQNLYVSGDEVNLYSFNGSSTTTPQTALSITNNLFEVKSPAATVSSILADTATGNTSIGGTLSFNVNGAGTSVTLPLTRGTAGQVLTTAGDGTTYWGANGSLTLIDTGTGLTGGPITSTGTISLANTAVTPGAYTNANITVDAQGRIIAAASGTGGGGGGLANFGGVDDISSQFDGVETVFTLTTGGSPLPAGLTTEDLLISLSGVLQYPGIAYSYSAGSITFTSAPLTTYTFNGRFAVGLATTIQVVGVPANSASPGLVNQVAFGGGYFYWYNTATSQWLRVLGSTF